jgi:hypothetical protein
MATLVFYKPFRKWVLLAGLLMHGFIEYSMNIPLFSFSICSLYVTFFEGDEVTEWARRLGERLHRFSLRVLLPAGMRLRPAPAAGLRAADALGLVSYQPGSESVWEAFDATGKQRNPFSASRLRSIGAWPLAVVPGLWRRMLYDSLEAIPAADEQVAKPKVRVRR